MSALKADRRSSNGHRPGTAPIGTTAHKEGAGDRLTDGLAGALGQESATSSQRVEGRKRAGGAEGSAVGGNKTRTLIAPRSSACSSSGTANDPLVLCGVSRLPAHHLEAAARAEASIAIYGESFSAALPREDVAASGQGHTLEVGSQNLQAVPSGVGRGDVLAGRLPSSPAVRA